MQPLAVGLQRDLRGQGDGGEGLGLRQDWEHTEQKNLPLLSLLNIPVFSEKRAKSRLTD